MKKKNTKALIVMSATAMLTLASVMTSMAATGGWVRDSNSWRYYNSNGDYVTDDWRKSGAEDYYLGDDGYLAKSTLIEDGSNYYATDSAGRMVKNAWREFYEDGENNWYYFQGTGKAKLDGFLTIGGDKYHFTDGKMDTGWFTEDGNTYFLNDEEGSDYGKMTKGWLYITDFDDDADVTADEEGWYYFGTNGKMVTDQEKKINGNHYAFDSDGLMLDNWVEYSTSGSVVATSSNATASDSNAIYKYYKEGSGQRVDGWRYLDDMTYDDDGRDTEAGWYYFKDGIPYSATYKTTDIADDYGVAKIDGKIYCFDKTGKMTTGKVTAYDGSYFYFEEKNDEGIMKSGKVKIKNSDDLEDGTYYFTKNGSLGVKGASVTGVVDGYLYDNGELVEADDGMKYQVVTVDGKEYLVNESGKVKTSGTVTDADDVKWKVVKNADGTYEITRVN